MKHLIGLIVITLIIACNAKQFVYRKPVTGYVYINNRAAAPIAVRYDSTDVLSRQDIVTDVNGRFVMPKVVLKNYQEFSRMSSRINSWLHFYNNGEKIFSIDLRKYDLSNDTINVGKINIE